MSNVFQQIDDVQGAVEKLNENCDRPQTVRILARFYYRNIQRLGTGKPEIIEYVFAGVEEMDRFYCKERNRRALADRVTSGEYRLVLTKLGQERIKEDKWARESHIDAINETWYSLRR